MEMPRQSDRPNIILCLSHLEEIERLVLPLTYSSYMNRSISELKTELTRQLSHLT